MSLRSHHTRAVRPVRTALIACSASAFVALAAISCASAPDSGRVTAVITPDLATYVQYVDDYLTRRCGTLDCHGQAGRAYRIYSREGYRLTSILDGSLVSGQQETQPEEKLANFQALIAIEPEEITRVMARQGQDPNTLLILRKPLKLERHKGGPAMTLEDPGYRCVTAWLGVPVVDGNGVEILPNAREPLSGSAIGNCTTAANIP